jgi:prepilin-type N-terminal cleavage/methylation domain-containing protein
MKLASIKSAAGFTLSEMTIGLAISSVIVAAALTATIALQRSFTAVDSYFATHMQQIRVIDYLSRDVNRGVNVTTSADKRSVTVSVPNYIIQAADPEAVANPALAGTPRTPTVAYTTTGWQVNYTATPSTVVYSITGLSIVRIENGTITTVASSTDQLVPETTDVALANTQYTVTNVKFTPIFTVGSQAMERSGTLVCSTAYLRNKRRG